MRFATMVLVMTLVGVLVPGGTPIVRAQHDHGHERAPGETAPTELILPDNLREALVEEMQAISEGMGLLLTNLAIGDADGSAEVAGKIRDTFLLKQDLTQAELKELISLLPEEFITMDRAFHGTAGKLSMAAAAGDFSAAIEHFATMSKACVSCHSSYAAQRFPKLKKEEHH